MTPDPPAFVAPDFPELHRHVPEQRGQERRRRDRADEQTTSASRPTAASTAAMKPGPKSIAPAITGVPVASVPGPTWALTTAPSSGTRTCPASPTRVWSRSANAFARSSESGGAARRLRHRRPGVGDQLPARSSRRPIARLAVRTRSSGTITPSRNARIGLIANDPIRAGGLPDPAPTSQGTPRCPRRTRHRLRHNAFGHDQQPPRPKRRWQPSARDGLHGIPATMPRDRESTTVTGMVTPLRANPPHRMVAEIRRCAPTPRHRRRLPQPADRAARNAGSRARSSPGERAAPGDVLGHDVDALGELPSPPTTTQGTDRDSARAVRSAGR